MKKCRYCNFIYNDDFNNFCVKCGRPLAEAASKFMVINTYGKKLVDEREYMALLREVESLKGEVGRLKESEQNGFQPVAFLIIRQNDDLSALPVNPGKNLYANRMSLKELPNGEAKIIRGMFRQPIRFAIYTNPQGFSIQCFVSGIRINGVPPSSVARLCNYDKITFSAINNFEIIFSIPTK